MNIDVSLRDRNTSGKLLPNKNWEIEPENGWRAPREKEIACNFNYAAHYFGCCQYVLLP